MARYLRWTRPWLSTWNKEKHERRLSEIETEGKSRIFPFDRPEDAATSVVDNAADAKQRLIESWLNGSQDQNQIIFDFETVPSTRGKNELQGQDENGDDIWKWEFDKSERGQEPFELGLSVVGNDGTWKHKSFMFTPQGINKYFHTHIIVDEDTGDKKRYHRPQFTPGERHHTRAMKFHEDQTGGNQARIEDIKKHVSPYTKGVGEVIPVPWGDIDSWLKGHGISPDKETNFVAHNGNFDYPMLERLLNGMGEKGNVSEEQGKGKSLGKVNAGLLGQLHEKSIDLHPMFATDGQYFNRSDTGRVWWNGAWNAEEAKKQGRRYEKSDPKKKQKMGELVRNSFGNLTDKFNRNKRIKLDDGTVAFRRKGDGANGARFHDSLIELSRLLGSVGPDNSQIALSKPFGTGKKTKTGKDPKWKEHTYFPIAYHANREWDGVSALAGTSLDYIRLVIGRDATFSEEANNHAKTLFTTIADALNTKGKNEFLFSLGLRDSMMTGREEILGVKRDENGKITRETQDNDKKSITAKQCYHIFNEVASHSGAGDTAFMTEILFPFMSEIIDVFDPSKYSKPSPPQYSDDEAHLFNEQNEAGTLDLVDSPQVKEFTDGLIDFQKRWGAPLGTFNKDSNNKYPEDNRSLSTDSDEFPIESYPLIKNICNNLRNPDAWEEDADGNVINPLLAHPKKKKSTARQTNLDELQAKADAATKAAAEATRQGDEEKADAETKTAEEANATLEEEAAKTGEEVEEVEKKEETTETEPDSTGLNILNEAIANTRIPSHSRLKVWNGGHVTFRKWKGDVYPTSGLDEYDTELTKDMIIASVPIGNSRVPFYEHRQRDMSGQIVKSTFKPFLGITTLVGADGKKDRSAEIIPHFADDILGKRDSTPTDGYLIGEEITDILNANLEGIRDHLNHTSSGGEGHYSLNEEQINSWLNTPYTAWLSEGLKNDQWLTEEDIYKKAGVEDMNEYQALMNKLGVDAREAGVPAGSKDENNLNFAATFGLSAPHLAGHLFNPEAEWFNVLEDLVAKGYNATEVAEGDLFQYPNPEDPTQMNVNLQQLKSLFLNGHGVDGIHPHQFLFDHPETGANLAESFVRFIDFMRQVHTGANNPDFDPASVVTSLGYENVATLPDLRDPISRTKDNKTETDPESSATDKEESANRRADHGDGGVKNSENVDEGKVATAEATKRGKEIKNNQTNQTDVNTELDKEIDSLGLDSSPFIIANYIESTKAQESLEAAYNALFPTRETGRTLDEVQGLLDRAVNYYGQEGRQPSAANLIRELEWIRLNHEDVFTQEAVYAALQTNDSESPQGRYLDLMNAAYKAMGSSAGDKLAVIQEEQAHMGNRFMGNSHRQYLRSKYDPKGTSNWHDLENDTTIQEHFVDEPEEEKRSFREIAREMATGAMRVPLEERVMTGAVNALKWYTGWENLSQQVKDAVSGREDAGKKLMDAVRRGEKFREVNIGTPEKPKYAKTEREYNYYIENLPVGSEAQPSVLRQFLQGRKTYGDLAREQEESQARKISRIQSSLAEQRTWEQQQIAERTAFAATDVTPEQQVQAVESGVTGRRARGGYAGEVRERLGQIRGETSETEGYKQTPEGIFVPKSLDKLRDYLLRV